MKTKTFFKTLALALCIALFSSAWNHTNAQYDFTVNLTGFVVDVNPTHMITAGFTYTWNWGDGSPNNVQYNPPGHVYNMQGTFIIALTVQDGQGQQVGLVSHPVTTTLPAFPFEVVAQNGLELTIQTLFPHLPNFDYLLSYNGGITNISIPISGMADITMPGYGTFDLCLSVYNPMDVQVGISTCVMVNVFEFCISPLFVGFELNAPESVECGSPVGICVELTGAGDPNDYCVDYDLGNGTVLEDVNMGEVCPFGFFYDCAGTYEIQATIRCCGYPGGLPKTLTHTITVTCDCTAPLASYFDMFTVAGDGEYCGHVGACFYMQNGGTYAELGGYCVSWDWGDGSADTETIVFSCPSHDYECDGTYTITATIYCCYNPCESITLQEDVTIDCPCDMDLGVTAWSFSTVDCTVSSTFYGACTEHCMHWEWGDGGTSNGNDVSHTYHASGTYTVELTIYCCDDPSVFTKKYHEVTVVCPCDLFHLNNFPWTSVGVTVLADPICMTTLGTVLYPEGVDPSQYCVRWFWGDGSGPENVQLGDNAFHSYASNGEYEVCARLFCCDNPGQSIPLDCHTITINCNTQWSPEPEIDPYFSYDIDFGNSITFHLLEESLDGHTPINVSWTVEDINNGVLTAGTGNTYSMLGWPTSCPNCLVILNATVEVTVMINGQPVVGSTTIQFTYENPPVPMPEPLSTTMSVVPMGGGTSVITVDVLVGGSPSWTGVLDIVITDELGTIIYQASGPGPSIDSAPLLPGSYSVGLHADVIEDNANQISDMLLFVTIPSTCPTDITGDGTTNISDMLLFLSAFGNVCP